MRRQLANDFEIAIHRSTTLAREQTTSHRGIPITTPIRTIIDLATTLRGRPLENALDLAEQRGLVDFAELREAIAARPTRPGSPSLQAMLSRDTAGTLPRPNVNTRIEGVEVDFLWRDARLIVEVDGYRYHRSPRSFEEDRARDVTLSVADWTVLRFTWAQITGRAAWVAAAIRRRLAS
jgi:very-short-patch-repair endonuclease